MSKVLVTDTNLTNIANAIRTKLGVQTTYTPSEMAAAIASIPQGGGSDYLEKVGSGTYLNGYFSDQACQSSVNPYQWDGTYKMYAKFSEAFSGDGEFLVVENNTKTLPINDLNGYTFTADAAGTYITFLCANDRMPTIVCSNRSTPIYSTSQQPAAGRYYTIAAYIMGAGDTLTLNCDYRNSGFTANELMIFRANGAVNNITALSIQFVSDNTATLTVQRQGNILVVADGFMGYSGGRHSQSIVGVGDDNINGNFVSACYVTDGSQITATGYGYDNGAGLCFALLLE